MQLFIVPLAAAAALALAAAPALAQSKKPRTQYHYGHASHPGWQSGGWDSRPVGAWTGPPLEGGWVNRPFSDPSNVSAGYLRAKALGRCVQDLGYGRYEYCD
ncbi:MAG: hypothetical protein E6G97_04325 [Alphaproteobacteria bacterium]|nr:MAG: hypothetical protein E6G97_04325 [Alphaproteobacteria bacterium]